jgi:hypothetical protein
VSGVIQEKDLAACAWHHHSGVMGINGNEDGCICIIASAAV